ncbi:hypothetical protein [Seonamhaeicola marinus]|uniref:Uncharacterized protein n=1 Tax=Seonamhaeicola marinus TaxID=1912246 RepID=A0A5D0HJG2_9FLAO|nr:hypothetical protein [Seonamhaeicola marinus]TYA71523.1 hypothetical protein FUA24_18265 [Seonamhaeicola marinus]
MKSYLAKISSIFFLTILLASNIVNLHVYFHHDSHEYDHHQNDDSNHDSEDNKQCDICLVAFNLNNLEYSTTPQFSFENNNSIPHLQEQNEIVYVDSFYQKFYLNQNRNKAPPYLA